LLRSPLNALKVVSKSYTFGTIILITPEGYQATDSFSYVFSFVSALANAASDTINPAILAMFPIKLNVSLLLLGALSNLKSASCQETGGESPIL
jgi:hypothetical protein